MLYLTYADLPDEIDAEAVRASFDSDEYMDAVCAKNNAEAVRQSLAALALLAETLKLAGVESRKLTLIKNERGRPSVKGRSDIDISLSHTKRAVACALMIGKNARVGVDIEERPTNENAERIARRFFSEGERDTVRQRGADGFVEVWTKKEALIKYLDGETNDLRAMDTEAERDEIFEILEIEGGKIALCRSKKSREEAKKAKIILKK